MGNNTAASTMPPHQATTKESSSGVHTSRFMFESPEPPPLASSVSIPPPPSALSAPPPRPTPFADDPKTPPSCSVGDPDAGAFMPRPLLPSAAPFAFVFAFVFEGVELVPVPSVPDA